MRNNFVDYDFRTVGDVLTLTIDFNSKFTIVSVNEALKDIKSKFVKGSMYANFSPKVCVAYCSIFGWTRSYKAYLTESDSCEYVDRPFFDEPTGKYTSKFRWVHKFNK